MEIILAIDIIGGGCVRLVKGKFKSQKIYSTNPLSIAQLFQKAGLKRVHIVDLEGAKEGKVKNWQTIEKIAKNTKLSLQVGGGFKTERDIKRILDLGLHQVTLGTIAVCEPEKLRRFFREFGEEKIIVDIGVKNNEIYFRGWQEKTKKDIKSFLRELIKLGTKTIICTDIGRDGTLRGPNFSLYKKLIREFPKLEIIASGGIRSKKDVEKLSKIGVAGVIIGKAIYEKKIKISELKEFLK